MNWNLMIIMSENNKGGNNGNLANGYLLFASTKLKGSSEKTNAASSALIKAANQLVVSSKTLMAGFNSGFKQLHAALTLQTKLQVSRFDAMIGASTEASTVALKSHKVETIAATNRLIHFSKALHDSIGVLTHTAHGVKAVKDNYAHSRKDLIKSRDWEYNTANKIAKNTAGTGKLGLRTASTKKLLNIKKFKPYTAPAFQDQAAVGQVSQTKDTPTGFWGKTKQAWTGLRKEHGRFTSSTKLATKGMKKGAKGLAIGGLKMLALGAAMKVLNLLTAPFKSFLDDLTKTFGSTNRVAGALGRTLGTGFQPMVNDINQFLITEFLPVMQRWANKIKIAYYAWKAFWKWLKDLNWDAVLNKISGGFLGVGGMLNTALSTALNGQSWSFGSVPSAIQGLLTTDFSTQIWDIPSIPSLVLTKIKSHFTNFAWTGFNFVPTLMTNLVTSIASQDFTDMSKAFITGLTSGFRTNTPTLTKVQMANIILQQII